MTPCPCCDLDVTPSELTALRAERDELAAWKQHILDQESRGKRPFSDRFAQAVIDSLVKELDRLRECLKAANRQAYDGTLEAAGA
ncbi:hypothetical protein C3941_23620 [Kaistia algarum]|uniref:hypothetical protein n=1 Tax=Kaistia algarum TaxID=2083279 RepID=UPI000CE80628|nr:hypothetical protein [Kaistia algarum]MCX5513453.1 hypothetical protein [Kaistia algarum]PPE77449.1 hypothetical protein C3941_23620 [Kaistia algarum]